MTSSFLDSIKIPPWLQSTSMTLSQPLIGKTCAKELTFQPISQWSKSCLSLTLSKLLGLGIVISGSIVKVPQILKVIQMQSSVGLSELAYWLETIASSIFVRYNIHLTAPFSTYGEQLFIVLQNLVLLSLMATSERKSWLKVLILGAALGGGLYRLPTPWLITLQSITLPLGLFSKLPSIATVLKQKHTGSLSVITVGAYFAGSLARIFTTLREVNDQLILLSYVLNGVLNGVLLFLIGWYWNATKKMTQKKSKKE